MVAPSVFTETPSVPTVRPPLSFGLTETLLPAETEIPSPAVTGVLPPAAAPPCGCAALIVTVCLPVVASVSEVTVIPPSPLNSTSLPLFTVEAAPPSAETFQPKPFKVVFKLPALTSFLSSSLLISFTLPFSLTVRSTVSGTSSLLSIFNPAPCFTLNLAERPSWSISIPPF